MGGCSVVGCSNRSEDGFILKRCPSDPAIRKLWVENISCNGWSPHARCVVCEVHFEPGMWEKVRVDGQRKLKANAVPTLFPYKPRTHATKPTGMVDIVLKDWDIRVSSASVTQSNENTVIEFANSDLIVDPLELGTRKRRKKSEINLAHKVDMYRTAIITYKQQMKQLEDRLKSQQTNDKPGLKIICGEAQTGLIKNASGKKWSEATIKNSLKLKFACGQSGYEELLRQEIPLPSLQTLRQHTQNLLFESGILNHVFEYLQLKVPNFQSEHHKDCTIHIDEVPVTPAKVYDPVKGKSCGTVTHVLVISLGGVGAEWQQTVAYCFTGDDVSKSEYSAILVQIIRKTEEVGLRVVSVTCSMEESNQRFWKSRNMAGEHHAESKNYMPHPMEPSKKIYILADVLCLFKNIKNMFVTNQIIKIPKALKQQFHLPSNVADFNHIKELISAQGTSNFKLVPTPTQESYISAHLINVNTSSPIISYDVSSGLKVLADSLERPEFKTTAWLIDIIEKWFAIMTSKHPALALSKAIPGVYEEKIDFLKDFINLFYDMQVGDNCEWQQYQMEVLLSTQSVLDIQNLLFNEKNYNYVITSRFTESCLDKLLGFAMSSQVTPTVAQFTNNLRLSSEKQYFEDVPKISFGEDTIKTENV